LIYYKWGQYKEEISDFSVVLNENSNDKDALLMRAECKDSIGDWLGAIEDREIAEEIIELHEGNVRIHSIIDEDYIEKGDQWIEQGNYEKGIDYYTKIIELSPQKPTAYFKRAYAYLDLGDIEKAYLDLKVSDSLSPNNASTIAEIAYCHYYRGEIDVGIKYATRAIKLNEKHPEANYYLGMLYLSDNQKAQGLKYLKKAILFGYQSGRAYYNLGVAYQLNNDNENACINWKISSEKGFEQADKALKDNCK
jgi:tetratricopeptide (TPR) repeat protein